MLRPQLQPWRDWRPWLALLTVVLPLGSALTAISLQFGRDLAQIHSLHGQPLDSSKFWADLIGLAAFVAPLALMVGVLSWASGFAVGTFSRRATGANAAVLILVWLGAAYLLLSDPSFYWQRTGNAETRTFQMTVMLVSHAIMFVAPVAAGLWKGHNGGYLSLRVAAAAAIVPAFVPAALILFSEAGVGNHGTGSIWGLVLFFGALSWPGTLLFARSYGARRRHHKSGRLT